MAINPTKTSLVRLSRSKLRYSLFGSVKEFHHESMTGVPVVPFVELYNPSNFLIVKENGSPLLYFKPQLSEINYKSLKQRSDLAVHSILKLKEKVLQHSSEVFLVLFPKDGSKVSRSEALRNYILNTSEFRTEILSITGKLKPNVNDFGAKLSELSGKLPLTTIQEKWKLMKEKLPDWQKTIAAKLQTIQDNINKKIN